MSGDSSVERIERPGQRGRFLSALRISDRRVLLIGMDLLAVNLALLGALSPRAPWPGAVAVLREHPLWFALLSVIWLIAAHTFDLYQLRVARRLGTCVPAAIKAGGVAAGVYLLIPYLTPSLPSSRLALVSLPVLLIAAVLLWRSAYILTVPQPFLQQRALIVGAGSAGRLIAGALAREAEDEYQVVGFIDDAISPGTGVPLDEGDETRGGAPEQPGRCPRLPVLGGLDDLADTVARHRVTTLVLSPPQQVGSRVLRALVDCAEQGVEVIPMNVLYEQLTGRVPVEHLHEHWHVALPVYHRDHSPLWRLAKRTMDIALAGAGLLVLSVLFPVIAAAVLLDSPGPVFYAQRRVGKGGRVFRVYKFRTMRVGAEDGSAMWAQENDPRATRVGRLLRATHLDEFPQFVNVLRGEMSAVGPRPERPEFVETLSAAVPFYPLRHAVKPGMAGWALVKQGYAATPEDALVRLEYDLYYIKHQSVWLDVIILLKTLGHALGRRGR